MFMPKARNCSTVFAIKYHIRVLSHFFNMEAQIDYKKKTENRKKTRTVKQFSLNTINISSRWVWHCSQYKSSFSSDLQNGCKIHFWSMSRVKGSGVAVAHAVYRLLPVKI